MSYPVYSERFLAVAGAAGVFSYYVPAGYRAVVKNVLCVNPPGSATYMNLYVAGQHIYMFRFPDSKYADELATMVVARAGNDVSIYMDGALQGITVSGYLLRETAGALEEPADPIHRTLDEYQLAIAAGDG